MRKSRWMLLAAGFAGLCLLSQEAAGQAKAQKGDAKPVPGLMTKKGGMLHVPSSGPVIQVMNAQKRVPEKEVTEVCQAIESAMRLEIRQAPATKAAKPMAEAARMVADPKCAAAIVVCDNPDLPMLLVAPEGKWALVNVAALAVDKPNQEKLTKRLRKEIWRGFGHLMGAAHSHFEACVMKSVRNPADLDALPVETVSPEPYVKIQQHARTIGASPYTMVSYRDACRQGWAPAPTNAIQQAVWDEVKREAAPTAAEKAAAQPK